MSKHDYEIKGCRNCGTTRHEERRAGYCARCHYKVRKASKLRRKLCNLQSADSRNEEFHLKYNLWQTERDLKTLRSLEKPVVQGCVDPLAIEGLLYALANATRAVPDSARYHNIGTQMFNRFHPDEYQEFYIMFYELLLDIVETLPARKFRKSFSTLWTWPNHSLDFHGYEAFRQWESQQFV